MENLGIMPKDLPTIPRSQIMGTNHENLATITLAPSIMHQLWKDEEIVGR